MKLLLTELAGIISHAERLAVTELLPTATAMALDVVEMRTFSVANAVVRWLDPLGVYIVAAIILFIL